MSRSQSVKLEKQLMGASGKGESGSGQIPPHFSLKGGMAHTVQAMWASRDNEKTMREIYYLTGLLDCMINQVNPILRTDVLRDLYRKVYSMKRALGVNWYGSIDHVLLPIDTHFYNEFQYRSSLKQALTLKKLYQAIREGTEEMFDILALEYVFYCPGRGGS
jgi:hypothetical protein